MSLQIPENYRFALSRAPFDMGVRVRLQRKPVRWQFWVTVDSMIPYNSKDPSVTQAELIEQAKELLWEREATRKKIRTEVKDMGL